MPRPTSQIQELARIGAAQRIKELEAEIAELRKIAGGGNGIPSPRSARPAARRKRSKMSPAQRKAVSARMRRYWAKRRAEKKTQAAKGKA